LLIVFKAENRLHPYLPSANEAWGPLSAPSGELRDRIPETELQVRRSLQTPVISVTGQSQAPASYVCSFPECEARSNGGASYSDLGGLKRHQLEHNPNAPRWICGSCGKKDTVRKDHLLGHLRNVHHLPKEALPLSCPICSYDLRGRKEGRREMLFTQASLDKHLAEKHGEILCSPEMSVDNFHALGPDTEESELQF
jgi:hypothetical protein